MKFYIDTANVDDVDYALTKLLEHNPAMMSQFGGVTTNPNAFHKLGISTYSEMTAQLLRLDTAIHKWRYEIVMLSQFTTSAFDEMEIHVQLPISTMTTTAAKMFIDDIRGLQLKSHIVFKFPPNLRLISEVREEPLSDDLSWPVAIDINVTGLTSAYECLRVLNMARVKYASLIPGRMEEAGLDS